MKFTTISNAKKQTGLAYLGGVNLSAKMIKNMKYSGTYTYSLYLSPANTSGYNACSHSTPECRRGCLATSGRAAIEIFSGINTIANARIKKTRLLFEHQEFFMQWLIADIEYHLKRAYQKGYKFSVRLNDTSDIDWANVKFNGQNIFEIFPDVQFYDYTKNHNKFENKPTNYHLTLSYTGRNWDKCKEVLAKGFNVAMVFNVKKETELPAKFDGFDVVNGDLTDNRIDDAKGVIIGLKWKRIADREAEKDVLNSCFVVSKDNVHCTF